MMNNKAKKALILATLAIILIAFTFGSIYMPPKTDKVWSKAPIEQVEGQQTAKTYSFGTWDYVIVVLYMVMIVAIGLLVSRKKKGETRTEEDYFLAGKSLPWWAIGSSLIAANISAEQFVGQSGSAYVVGLGIATYEWMAAFTLIIVGKYFLPIFIEKKIYTIPEFVEKRYSSTLKTILSVFWLCLYIFVNLATVMLLGALAMVEILGLPQSATGLLLSLLILAFFAAAYSLYGGLSAVAWTDVIQVVVLILGGVVTTVLALKNVNGRGIFAGLNEVITSAPEHFEMILSRNNPEFTNLPGIGVLLGGMWVANLYYWGFNQYIIQRTFAAKSLKESQKGIAFAAIIKIIIPFIVVIPGIACYVMVQKGILAPLPIDPSNGREITDSAYPHLMSLLPPGVKGVAFAALIAAIVSSLASMLNSTATIFTMDIYKPYIEPAVLKKRTAKAERSGEKKALKPLPSGVNVGRITAFVALLIALPIAFFLRNTRQVFQFIQEWTGLVSPGILAIFLLGLFYKKATTKGAIVGVLCSIPVALAFKIPTLLKVPGYEFPFMHQMGLTLVITMAIVALVSWIETKGKDDALGIELKPGTFKTHAAFNIIAFTVMIILVTLYVLFWNTGMVQRIFC